MIRAVVHGTTLQVQGHANSAPYGQDLVCAAVSALVYALAQRLTELDAQGALEQPPMIRLSSGDAQISALAKRGHEAEVFGDFHLIKSGLTVLQTHYPDRVQVGNKI